MPGKDGLDTLKELKRGQAAACRVLILSVYPEEQYAVRLLQGRGCRIPDQGERPGGAGRAPSGGSRRVAG